MSCELCETSCNAARIVLCRVHSRCIQFHLSLFCSPDDSKCSSSVCQNGTRCWRVQSSYSCVCKDCPRMPTQKTSSASTSSSLSTTNIIIIIVVMAVVALIIIIVVIICVIRSSKDPEDEKYGGSHYSSDTEERYNTSFAN